MGKRGVGGEDYPEHFRIEPHPEYGSGLAQVGTMRKAVTLRSGTLCSRERFGID
jgi:hypothetical protein